MDYTYQVWLDAMDGHEPSVECVIKQFTPLVHKLVKKYAFMASSHQTEDLFQEGVIGIVKALRTFDPERNCQPFTWVFWKVRSSIQSMTRNTHRQPKYNFSLEQVESWSKSLADPDVYEVPEDSTMPKAEDILVAGCGSTDSKRAMIVRSRYGLMGEQALRQGEVAAKFGMSKQAINSHISSFKKKIQSKYPHLQEFLR